MRVIVMVLDDAMDGPTAETIADVLEHGDPLLDWTGVDGTLTLKMKHGANVALANLTGQHERIALNTKIPVVNR